MITIYKVRRKSRVCYVLLLFIYHLVLEGENKKRKSFLAFYEAN